MAEDKKVKSVASDENGADKSTKVEKKAKKDKPSLKTRISTFIREYKSELKKVVWASKKDVLKNSTVVLVVSVVSGVVVGLLDLGLSEIVKLLGNIN